MRLLFVIAYDGTNYCGWQRQRESNTLQQLLEDTYYELTGEKVEFVASGRTDAGVHALGQVAHIDTNTNIPIDRICIAMNTKLPKSIRIMYCKQTNEDFHARFSAKKKTYIYKVTQGEIISPFHRDTHTQVKESLDIEAMRIGARYIIGEHNFACFMASGSVVKNTVRTVYSLDITINDTEIVFSITGNGFLYNMVRIIVGTLVAVGSGKMNPPEIADIIARGDRTNAGKTMPAHGLYLMNVEYS